MPIEKHNTENYFSAFLTAVKCRKASEEVSIKKMSYVYLCKQYAIVCSKISG